MLRHVAPVQYYHYEDSELPSGHSVVRRSYGAEDKIYEGLKLKLQITTVVPIINGSATTVVPPVGSHVQAVGSYITLTPERYGTAMNLEDPNRTSWRVPSNSSLPASSGPTVPYSNVTTVSSTVPPHSNTKGPNATLMLLKGISPENSSDAGLSDEANITITIDQFSQPIDNNTLHDHNIPKYQQDYHQYYNSSFISNNELVGHQYWVNMTDRTDVQVNDMLSQSHRRAATVKLSFNFPFYGHLVRNVTIATGGFLYTGEYVHSWLAATQYIAPLMANFDTSISNESYVKYVDNGTAFTVQWEKVVLQDKPDSGDFTFQATLRNNGDIVFVYQNVPVVIESIQDDHHPVKVGLSDAYIIDRTIFFVRRKTIYEYHRVNFNRQDIRNWTVIVLHALPTCVDQHDCASCLAMSTDFQCQWCPAVNRCSSGMDRHRQDWLYKGCDKRALSNTTQCPPAPANSSFIPQDSEDGPQSNRMGGHTNSVVQTDHIQSTGEHSAMRGDVTVPMSVSGIIGILFVIALVAGLGILVLYAYRNPHSTSGQFLIRYRPSQWSWKRGEARYTAATIHM
ncbi:plexin domain-containing protein 2 isoform X2 [Zootermopsis nevadensis]|uniref:plexin domain-containing protein 2 isoform X2 n=1 Tax=Zootermopsis nevadensis TaxID=136037 RepID=UPI000B8E6B6A|nr:plexin domain-containing protein 2 isoform X2 [Zootermopsis nevadensis]